MGAVSRASRAAAILAAAALVACAPPTSVRVLPFPMVAVTPVRHIQGIFTYESALATIGAVFERDFNFPPIVAAAHLYPDARTLEAELLAIGYDPELAHDAATRMRAIALHRRVLVNEAVVAESGWPARVGTLAHELVHCLQYELGGGRRGTSEQWLREGFAELIAMRLLERIQAIPAGAAHRWLRDELASSDLSEAPRLDDMRTFRQWVALAGRLADVS